MTAAVLPTAAEVISGTQTNAQQKVDFASLLNFLAENVNKGTTGGTSTDYTLTLDPPTASLETGQCHRVTFNAANGASPTLAVDGHTAKSLKVYDGTGAKVAPAVGSIAANQISWVVYDGTDFVVLDPLPLSPLSKIQPITASVGSNALTVTLNPTSLDFRSATAGSGTTTPISNAAAISVVISTGSTLGSANGVATRLAVVAINNGGTMELAVANVALGMNLDETAVISTTAEGGAGAADSARTFYSTSARSNVAYRVVGFIEYTQATAGTYATAPSLIQGAGGESENSFRMNATGSAPLFGVRAWCTFDGTVAGTNAPTAGGNVTSVTRNGAGDYTLNFTTALPNANYAVSGTVTGSSTSHLIVQISAASAGSAPTLKSTTQCEVFTANGSGATDPKQVTILVIG